MRGRPSNKAIFRLAPPERRGTAERPPGKEGTVDAFAYTEPGGRLEVLTEPLATTETRGIVREALLTTTVDAGGTSLNRLRLLVNVVEAGSLDFAMPAGLTLVRVKRDGADVTPIQSSAGLSIPLAASGQGSKSSTVDFEYVADGVSTSDGARLRPDLPRFPLPCLSFEWEILTAGNWLATDPCARVGRHPRGESLGLAVRHLGSADAHVDVTTQPYRPSRRRHAPFSGRPARRSGLGRAEPRRMVQPLGRGPRPVVIDRVALHSAGLGPGSQCVPTIGNAERRGVARSTLKRYGLALVPFDGIFVITTESELRQPLLPTAGRASSPRRRLGH